MSPAGVLKLLHVAGAMWLVAGLAGRATTMRQAARAERMVAVEALVGLASRFERSMVRPATFAVLATGLASGWLQGLPFGGLFQGGSSWLMVSLLIFLSIFILIPTVFVPRGVLFRKALHQALDLGKPTPELARAFADPVVRAAHTYEWIGLVVVITLMVTRPF